jgi:flagellum-specific peptidoglycan hydrolase FlgJ
METLETRLNEVARIAVRLEQETGCPAQLMIAQWAIESAWGAKPVGHANYFGVKRAARHTMWCTVTTQEVLTPAQLEAWDHQHATRPARPIETLPDGRHRVEIDDEFADYASLNASCQDYAWLITHEKPYRETWQRYQQNKDLADLIGGVAQNYATAPGYAKLGEEIATQSNVLTAIAVAASAQ